MGFTSRAKMAQMKFKDPINGYLTEGGRLPVGGTVRRSDFILPRVEAEIAVVTSRPLRGPGCTIAQVQASIDYVLPALELIDSRYPNYGFDLASVIAEIGRAHVRTTVTNAHIVWRLLLEKRQERIGR